MMGGCVTYLQGADGHCFDFDAIPNNDAYAHMFTIPTPVRQRIDTAIDDGNLATGTVRDCRGGLVYLIGEGPRW